MMLRRKSIWLVILMIWVGMVTSIIIYQGNDYLALERVTSDKVDLVNPEMKTVDANPQSDQSTKINFTQARDEESGKDFFIEYRLERDKARSEQINIYREMINNPNTDPAAKKEATRKMLQLTEKMEKELEIESLIRARGYQDALAYIHNNAVDVIIQTNGLQKEDVARVGDIIVKSTGFGFKDVTIIEKRIDGK